ncbi:MAG TPA: HAMP domain-containing sensor histidine kinase [Candidatus Dormibacteraeota bacterium]|nr:HAMP domain-containing sensor histidine kinase [Candidatus Dormibacteraeota bacterium]
MRNVSDLPEVETLPTMESGALFAALLDALPFGMMAYDEGGTCVFANRRALALLGLAGAPAEPRMIEAIDRTREAGPRTEHLQGRGGALYEVAGEPLMLGGQRYHAVRIADLTLEDDVIRSQSTAASDLVHTLRGPLTALRGFLELAVEEPAEAGEYAKAALDAALRVQQIVDDILSLATLAASGHEDQDIRCGDVGMVARQAVSAFEPSGRVIRVSVPDDVPAVAMTPAEVRMILLNFIGNAVKYSEAPAPIDLEATLDGHMVVICVRDNGPGIEPPKQSLIFRRYQRLGVRGVQGTGLGLAAVRELVLQRGGGVYVESEVGKGSAFFVRIPVKE